MLLRLLAAQSLLLLLLVGPTRAQQSLANPFGNFGQQSNIQQSQPTDFNAGFNTNPNTGSAFSGFEPRGPGQQQSMLQHALRFTDPNFDWKSYDRRQDERWYHLYGFGERYHDMDISYRPWMDRQIDLDFFFPYYGFRFNYTFIFPEGFIAFSFPHYIQPPYTFPNDDWPKTADPSLIAAFMIDQTLMAVGEHRLSHVWYRVVSRPPNLIGVEGPTWRSETDRAGQQQPGQFGVDGVFTGRTYRGQLLRTQEGRLEDPEFLDQLSRDIREGQIGARGFTADYALVVTWERMAYGGAPRVTNLNMYAQVRSWQNTYQMVIATDEVRSFVVFNYANINWTSSTSAGALTGRGGKQSAVVGFNGGNGTGFYEMPYSAEGNSYKLVQFGATPIAGRWQARVDENITYGGCTNDTVGIMDIHPTEYDMLGGMPVNVSGPCFRPNDRIKLQIDVLTVDCYRINMAIARCIIPVYSLYVQGANTVKISIDGGKSYPFHTVLYINPIERYRLGGVRLIDDPIETQNSWRNPAADSLLMRWPAVNVSSKYNSRVDVTLWGYYEETLAHDFRMVGRIGVGLANTGTYEFRPSTLWTKDQELRDRDPFLRDTVWKKYWGGSVQIKVAGEISEDEMGDVVIWSPMIPFGWYFKQKWEWEYGVSHYALQMCVDWFEYDGRRQNFVMEQEINIPCPCKLEQALADFGRFAPYEGCDKDGDSFCYYHQAMTHCVISTMYQWTGSAQVCCYGSEGFLSFAEDFEYGNQYLRFYSPGTAWRAHPFGTPPYRRPPFVPGFSNFYNDLMPYDLCCKWAEHCEFYFWRRPTSGCQAYRSPKMGFAYGLGHFITFDGVKYSFPGNGYFVLTALKSPVHDLMVQVRMEQPEKTFWDQHVPATVITGMAAADNGSAKVEVFARGNFRRWRYRTDVKVDGVRYFFDRPHKRWYNFNGVSLRVPMRTTDMGTIEIMFTTGVGVRVQEYKGALAVTVSLPPNYNVSLPWDHLPPEQKLYTPRVEGDITDCKKTFMTMGLLGTFNNRMEDDLMTPECQQSRVGDPPNEAELVGLYNNFGERWRADGIRFKALFGTGERPLYYPSRFADLSRYKPMFSVRSDISTNAYRDLVFSLEQVNTACQGVPSCVFDYFHTGIREIGLQTLAYENQFEGLKDDAEQRLISCGPLLKSAGVLKYPQFDNYLDGRTVTFDCQPDYFLHGEKQRTCVNGTWTPGWWVWCRSRNFEYFLKWLIGLGSSFLIIFIIAVIFLMCYARRRGIRRKSSAYASRQQMAPAPLYPPVMQSHQQKMNDQSKESSIPVMQTEPHSLTPVQFDHHQTPI